MADVTPEGLGSQFEQLLRELAEIRKELGVIRAVQADLSSEQTAMAQALLYVKRDCVIKDILASSMARSAGWTRKKQGQRGGSCRATLCDVIQTPAGGIQAPTG
jgi:hypothetical protein